MWCLISLMEVLILNRNVAEFTPYSKLLETSPCKEEFKSQQFNSTSVDLGPPDSKHENVIPLMNLIASCKVLKFVCKLAMAMTTTTAA